MTLLEALLKVKSGIAINTGLCANIMLHSADRALGRQFTRLYKQWPKYSGNALFPIKAICKSDRGNRAAYERACWQGTLYEGEYGKLRLELLDWCIEELSK